jgi:hypothetical protein
MTSALTYKELRESGWIAALALAAMLVVSLGAMGYSFLPGGLSLSLLRQAGTIPFLNDGFLWRFGLIAAALAIALGLRQSLGDMQGEAQLFLLHRPVSWRLIYAVKLVVGLGLYLVAGGIAIGLYALWAATPGTHPSPFYWSMTLATWNTWLALALLYLGALLAGIRPAAWLGTRLAPLGAAAAAALLACSLPLGYGLLVLAAAVLLLVPTIFHVIRVRDFA